MTSRTGWLLGLVLLVVALAGAASASQARRQADASCPPPQSDPAYNAGVNGVLASGQDVWGNALLRSRGGPTYEGARRFLHPLLLVGPPQGSAPNRLTDSGVYYLAFGRPAENGRKRAVDLHVADGSQIVSGHVREERLTVRVGQTGAERYGSCLARLAPARLWRGYLPVLETKYVDADGVRYSQESFATRLPQTGALVSFVRVIVDPRHSGVPSVRVRFTPSVQGLRAVRNQLRLGKKTLLVFGPGARRQGRAIVFTTPGNRRRTVYAAWLARPAPVRGLTLGPRSYRLARRSVALYWNRRLAAAGSLVVPDVRVRNAERNLLIQNLLHSWRYSLGNAYERFSWEEIDVAEVMGAYGFTRLERAMVEKAFRRTSVFPNRADGERMVGTADYYRRSGDARFVERVTPSLRDALAGFELQLAHSTTGLLDPEQYGVDIPASIYGLHDQALALQGLRAMAGVWADTGHAQLAARATSAAVRLDGGLRAAVGAAESRLADGSLFIPVVLLDPSQRPFGSVTESLAGSYWNLVMPYALSSGLFPPGSPEARGLLAYMLGHGSRFLGLVRFRAFLETGKAGYRAPGSDDVYGTNVARFLADNDQADQLILSLYGKLGSGMTRGTFVSGEGSTIGPVGGEYFRSMFRPPNSANNAFFLETLRLMLVHETRAPGGAPTGLELAYSTPRRWLLPGHRIVVRGVRTSFGVLSYSLTARRRSVRVRLAVPSGLPPRTLRLRLRLPVGRQITAVAVGGRALERFDPHSGTIDLSGLSGRLSLVARYS